MKKTIIYAALAVLLLALLTAAAPGGRGRGGVAAGIASPRYVTETMVFKSTWLTTSTHADYPADPDSVVTDTDGTNFKYFPYIWNANAEIMADSCRASNSLLYLSASNNTRGGWPVGNYPQGGAGGAMYTALWFPLSSLPTGDVTILSAKLCLYNSSTAITWGTGRGIWAVLDTLDADTPWLTAGVCTGISNAIARKVSWNLIGGVNHIRNGVAYSPPLTSSAGGNWRDDPFDWGPSGDIHSANLGASEAFNIDATWPVQAYLNRRALGKTTNAGFWIFASHQANGTAVSLACGPTATAAQNPFLVVEYQRKEYRGPWNGKKYAFVFATDDIDTCNIKYAAILDSLGFEHTMFASGSHVGSSAGKLTWPQLLALYNSGSDIQPHGRKHVNLGGVTSEDSISREISRTWLASGLGLTDTTQFSVFAYPSGGWRNIDIDNLASFGYRMARIAAPASAQNALTRVMPCSPYPALGDSSLYLQIGSKSAMYAFSPLVVHTDMFWGVADTLSLWGLRERVDHMIDKSDQWGLGAMMMFCHDTKVNTIYPSEGIDYDDLSWFMKRLKNRYGDMIWFCTMKELSDYYYTRGQAQDPPTYKKSYADGIRAVDKWYIKKP